MEIAQTLCNDCAGELTAAEKAQRGPRKILICGTCAGRALKVTRTGWRFTWQWDSSTGTDGLKLVGQDPVPWKDPRVVLLHVTPHGAVQATHTLSGKRAILKVAGETDLLLVAWPGYNRQGILVVDDPAAALRALA